MDQVRRERATTKAWPVRTTLTSGQGAGTLGLYAGFPRQALRPAGVPGGIG